MKPHIKRVQISFGPWMWRCSHLAFPEPGYGESLPEAFKDYLRRNRL